MKRIWGLGWVLFLALVLSAPAAAQSDMGTLHMPIMPPNDYGRVVQDSIVWRTVAVDSMRLGREGCDHEWVYSRPWRAGGTVGCLALHGGFHCDYDDQMKNRICQKCGRKEMQREFWYEHREPPVPTLYDLLEKGFQDSSMEGWDSHQLPDSLFLTNNSRVGKPAKFVYQNSLFEGDTLDLDTLFFKPSLPAWTEVLRLDRADPPGNEIYGLSFEDDLLVTLCMWAAEQDSAGFDSLLAAHRITLRRGDRRWGYSGGE